MAAYRTDIEIAQDAQMLPISKIADEIGLSDDYLEHYGKYKAKIDYNVLKTKRETKDGKLILVTAITPTPAGEGKTTVSVGLADGLRQIGKKAVVALREPSLGPVFGVKGGRYQPAFYRRYSRHRRGKQPAGGHDRQPYLPGQCPSHRS